jgi:hypothetical protein
VRFETGGGAEMTCSEHELGLLARQRIESGELPCYRVRHLWGSHGSGACCALCDQPIRTEEIEYEVASDPEAVEAAQTQTLRFHMACHAIWQAECARAGGAGESGRAGESGGAHDGRAVARAQ